MKYFPFYAVSTPAFMPCIAIFRAQRAGYKAKIILQ